MVFLLASLSVAIGALLVDGIAIPRHFAVRSLTGASLLILIMLAAFGIALALSGNAILSAVVALALELLLVVASNAKRRMLGEPLHFSDLALIGAVFRHPQFYFSALAAWQKVAGAVVGLILAVALARFFNSSPLPHVVGAGIAVAAIGLLAIAMRLPGIRSLAQQPRAEADVAKLGLVPTLFLYWRRWRASKPGASPAVPAQVAGDDDHQAEIIVAIQCESFADPAELFGNPALALPGLDQARDEATQWGNLHVSGFGAYTMRTEYGVLFGREEEDLGFRQFDPFLTAMDDHAHAIPHKLGTDAWRSLFVHPHDMRFYSRDRILPAAGFAEFVTESDFEPPAPGEGRYVKDSAVAQKVLELSSAATTPSFIYAVTMENHGPWAAEGEDGLLQNYNRLVRAGDEMLTQLRKGLASLRRPALLVFFGDHRPSIPGWSEPSGERHTPYVMLRFDRDGNVLSGCGNRRDLTPAQLHHDILRWGMSCRH